MTLTIMLSFIFAIILFVAIPTGITFLLKKLNLPDWSLSAIEGVISIGMLLGYMYLMGKVDDIERVFQYHGAEHKTIFCYENEDELTVENVRKYPRFHPYKMAWQISRKFCKDNSSARITIAKIDYKGAG